MEGALVVTTQLFYYTHNDIVFFLWYTVMVHNTVIVTLKENSDGNLENPRELKQLCTAC